MRLRAVRALGSPGDEEDVPVLVGLLARKGLFSKTELEEIRRAAVVALAGIVERTGSEQALRGLEGTVQSDPSEEVRKIAEECIAAHQTSLMKTQPL